MKKVEWNDSWIFKKQEGTECAVTLPHDAMLEETRDADCVTGSAGAYFPGGLYTYEKKFKADPKQHMEICFEGVYRNAKVTINGKEAGGVAYGYIPFSVCTDGLLQEGENTITVTADNSQFPNSRWYSGSGIYRPVWLYISGDTYIARNGIKVTTISYDPVIIQVDVEANGGEALVEILDGETVIAEGTAGTFQMEEVQLWSEETPKLYTCRVTLRENGDVLDSAETTFGIRKLEWNKQGFYVNGQNTLLRGGCVHHDNGILGARSYKESEWRRVQILKESGFNAIRSSHNPASEEMIAACDYYGVYIMDETWDMWYTNKNPHDYACDFMENYKNDIKAMVDRDYNHPSVIMYSIGNEVSEPAAQKGVDLAKEMVSYIHELDKDRAVTGGMNLMIISRSATGADLHQQSGGDQGQGEGQKPAMDSTMFNMMAAQIGAGMNMAANTPEADEITTPLLDALDIAGYNYASGRYPLEETAHPDRIIVGSETLPGDIAKNWEMVKKYPYLIGDFMWTSWDYLGETGIGGWSYTDDGFGFGKPYPWILADTGAIDILGNPNGELYKAQAVWGLLKEPKIAVQPVNHQGDNLTKSIWRSTNALPGWSWKDCDGNDAVVEVYISNAASVELLLNGKSYGKKEVSECMVSFEVKYEPGILTAVAYDTQGNKTSESTVKSAKTPAAEIVLQKDFVAAGEVIYVPVHIVDSEGIIERNADEQIRVNVTGGELLAFGSANPRTEESYLKGTFTTYYGQALAIVKAGQAGTILQIQIEGEQSGRKTVKLSIQ